MAPLRVLLLAYYFPPLGGMGSLRALGFARHLRSFGVDVAVVAPRTGTYGEDPSLLPPEGVLVRRAATLEPGVLVRAVRGGGRGGVTAPWAPGRAGGLVKGLLQRLVHVPDANVGWVPGAVRAAVRLGRDWRPDVLLSSAPPLSAHLAARWAGARLGVPAVLDFRDFPAAQRLFGGVREEVDRRLLARALRGARGIVAASEGILADLAPRTSAPGIVVRNGYDEEDFAGPVPRPPPRKPLRLLHVGSTYADRGDPRPLLRAMGDALDRGEDLRLRFVGRTDAELSAAVREAGLAGRVELAGFLPHREAVAEMRGAGALLFFMWESERHGVEGQILGKTLEYLRSGRPILALLPLGGENAGLFRALGGAILRERSDRGGILDGLLRLAEGRTPAPADPAALRPHCRGEQVRRLAVWLEGLVGSRG